MTTMRTTRNLLAALMAALALLFGAHLATSTVAYASPYTAADYTYLHYLDALGVPYTDALADNYIDLGRKSATILQRHPTDQAVTAVLNVLEDNLGPEVGDSILVAAVFAYAPELKPVLDHWLGYSPPAAALPSYSGKMPVLR